MCTLSWTEKIFLTVVGGIEILVKMQGTPSNHAVMEH